MQNTVSYLSRKRSNRKRNSVKIESSTAKKIVGPTIKEELRMLMTKASGVRIGISAPSHNGRAREILGWVERERHKPWTRAEKITGSRHHQ